MTEPGNPLVEGLYVGLISGTSMDGLDIALVSLEASRLETLASVTKNYPQAIRARLLQAIAPGEPTTVHEIAELNSCIGQFFGETTSRFLAEHQVDPDAVVAIGSHGQTLRHHAVAPNPYSWQIGDPATIAARTGITTVADFRALDIAYGGAGAPLVPPFHAWCFQDQNNARAILNIGGIANITVLPQSSNSPVAGFDTGPGNCLLDAWSQEHTGKSYDDGGRWATSGTVSQRLLTRLLDHDYFTEPAPKSTGRELFNLAYLNSRLDDSTKTLLAPADVQATLLEFTVETITRELDRYADDATQIFVCGGGVHNTALMSRLRHRLSARTLESVAQLGLDPDMVEAAAFAWFAAMRVAHRSVPLTTGASPPALILGAIYEAAGRNAR